MNSMEIDGDGTLIIARKFVMIIKMTMAATMMQVMVMMAVTEMMARMVARTVVMMGLMIIPVTIQSSNVWMLSHIKNKLFVLLKTDLYNGVGPMTLCTLKQ